MARVTAKSKTMTKKTLLILAVLFSMTTYAQNKFFRTYTDSTALVQDANHIVTHFTEKVNAISPVFTSPPVAILNTKPFLIFYSPKSNTVNLPIWQQVIPEQKKFFQSLAGNEQNGKEMFGLFFNGFYLPHELGHALQKPPIKEKVVCTKTNTLPTSWLYFIGEKQSEQMNSINAINMQNKW